ncbi:MAG: twin-arginine translocase TatA/TatE family subunit [Caldilineales bacterium]|nr:twin-arginine translocase TatA/TatE family subunit [Caldilineales bacterium]
MPNIGLPEVLIVLLIVLLIFGAGKLPEVFRSLGSGIREFREAASNEPRPEDKKEEPEITDTTEKN